MRQAENPAALSKWALWKWFCEGCRTQQNYILFLHFVDRLYLFFGVTIAKELRMAVVCVCIIPTILRIPHITFNVSASITFIHPPNYLCVQYTTSRQREQRFVWMPHSLAVSLLHRFCSTVVRHIALPYSLYLLLLLLPLLLPLYARCSLCTIFILVVQFHHLFHFLY